MVSLVPEDLQETQGHRDPKGILDKEENLEKQDQWVHRECEDLLVHLDCQEVMATMVEMVK